MAGVIETWGSFPAFVRRTVATVGFLSALAGVLSLINSVTGTNVRPAWAWEIEALNQKQLEVHLSLEQINRREFSRDHSRYLSMREEFRRKDETIPTWLVDEISRGEEDIRRVNNLINRIQSELVGNQ